MVCGQSSDNDPFIFGFDSLDGLESIRGRIAAIREEKDTTKRIKMLRELNDSLPSEKRIEFPSLITNAYIRTALDKIDSIVGTQAD